jgi:hypothetical protein
MADQCKDCNCTMKYVNNSFNKNMKNILCRKNNSNIKFIIPIEIMFYFTTFSFSYYHYHYNDYHKNDNNKIKKYVNI